MLRPFEGKHDALILDHAANALRHGRPEDFVPPQSLSHIDKRADRKTKDDRAEAVTCQVCLHVYPAASRTCPECGHIRARKTASVVLDGELQQVDLDDQPQAANEPPPKTSGLSTA